MSALTASDTEDSHTYLNEPHLFTTSDDLSHLETCSSHDRGSKRTVQGELMGSRVDSNNLALVSRPVRTFY